MEIGIGIGIGAVAVLLFTMMVMSKALSSHESCKPEEPLPDACPEPTVTVKTAQTAVMFALDYEMDMLVGACGMQLEESGQAETALAVLELAAEFGEWYAADDEDGLPRCVNLPYYDAIESWMQWRNV